MRVLLSRYAVDEHSTCSRVVFSDSVVGLRCTVDERPSGSRVAADVSGVG